MYPVATSNLGRFAQTQVLVLNENAKSEFRVYAFTMKNVEKLILYSKQTN